MSADFLPIWVRLLFIIYHRAFAVLPLKPLRVDSALRALSTLRCLRGTPVVPPLCRETQSPGQQMLNAPVGINGLNPFNFHAWTFVIQPREKLVCGAYLNETLKDSNETPRLLFLLCEVWCIS